MNHDNKYCDLIYLIRFADEQKLLTKPEITRIVDKIIFENASAPPVFSELSLVAGKGEQEVNGICSEFLGEYRSAQAGRQILGLLYQKSKESNFPLGKLTRSLETLRLTGILPEYDFCPILGLDDAYHLAFSRTFGTLQEVSGKVSAYLERYRDYSLTYLLF